MYEITVPKLNSNDAGYVLTTWFFADGDTVPPGAEVAVVETSKAAEELSSEIGGVLQRGLAESQECRPGEVIGRVFADEEQRQQFLAADAGPKPAAAPAAGLVITEPAQRLIGEHGIDPATIAALGKKVIGTADVRRLLDTSGPRLHRLSRGQLAVAEVVTTSWHTIPAAYAVVAVTVDKALDALAAYEGRAGLPELLMRCVAGLFDRFPLCFASPRDDGTAVLADEARIGVTVDVGRGLTIPVVDAEALRSLATISRTMTALRGKALRDRLTEADLTGATIALSLPAGDVLLAQPIIPPGLACMLALGATYTAAAPDPDGGAVFERTAYLGLSYDHRLINGRDAAQFLSAIKDSLESPELI